MTANWFLVIDGTRHGLFTALDIRGLASREEIPSETMAWRPGRDPLTPAGTVPVASFVARATLFAKRPMPLPGCRWSVICCRCCFSFVAACYRRNGSAPPNGG